MRTVYFVTHPEVNVDPATPVTKWGLSSTGLSRMRAFAAHPFRTSIKHIFSSDETKAAQAAAVLGGQIGIVPRVLAGLGENDRSATGFMPKERFEAAADQFFMHPDQSYLGWETAADAQNRIISAVAEALRLSRDGNIAIVSHGAVGTLLKCRLKGIDITRVEDQRMQGNYYVFDDSSSFDSGRSAATGPTDWHLRCDWTAIETIASLKAQEGS